MEAKSWLSTYCMLSFSNSLLLTHTVTLLHAWELPSTTAAYYHRLLNSSTAAVPYSNTPSKYLSREQTVMFHFSLADFHRRAKDSNFWSQTASHLQISTDITVLLCVTLWVLCCVDNLFCSLFDVLGMN